MTEAKKTRKKPAAEAVAASESPEKAKLRLDLTKRLYALAGVPERSGEFESVRAELEALG